METDRDTPTRRSFLKRLLFAATTAGVFLAGKHSAIAATEPKDILWEDLIPDLAAKQQSTLNKLGIVQHGGPVAQTSSELGSQVVAELAGQNVRIPGYIVPLDYNGKGVKELLLVPYVGACIHVPPPPPNQIILVRSKTAYEPSAMFERSMSQERSTF